MIQLSKAEIEEIFNYLDNTKLHGDKSLFYKMQYYYARRSEEITVLRVKDIDFDLNRITFNIAKKKDKTVKQLKLIPVVKDHLHSYIEEKALAPDDFIFIDVDPEATEEEIKSKKDSFKRKLRKYLERNSCKITRELFNKNIKLNTHDFRRLRGQHMYLAGAKIEHLQELYQHIDINTTITYLQIDTIIIDNLLDSY